MNAIYGRHNENITVERYIFMSRVYVYFKCKVYKEKYCTAKYDKRVIATNEPSSF